MAPKLLESPAKFTLKKVGIGEIMVENWYKYHFSYRKACCGLRILHVWGPTKSTISKDCAIQNSQQAFHES